MKWIFLILYSLPASADHHQVIKPIKIQDIVNYATFKITQSLNQFYKTTYGNELISPDHLRVSYPSECSNQYGLVPLDLHVTTAASLERLTLSQCDLSKELYSIEKKGKAADPTPSSDLIRGNLPSPNNYDFYRLKINDGHLLIEIKKENHQEKMFLVITGIDGKPTAEVTIVEESSNGVLQRQTIKAISYPPGGSQQFDIDYIWRKDGPDVPKQYLYFQGAEVAPDIYLELQNDLYNQSIYAIINVQVQFFKAESQTPSEKK